MIQFSINNFASIKIYEKCKLEIILELFLYKKSLINDFRFLPYLSVKSSLFYFKVNWKIKKPKKEITSLFNFYIISVWLRKNAIFWNSDITNRRRNYQLHQNIRCIFHLAFMYSSMFYAWTYFHFMQKNL